MTLEGRVALVTGGSRGIGRAIALALAGSGADVAVNYRRDGTAAQEVVQAVTALGHRARAYQADVSDSAAVHAMADAIAAQLGSIDILVSNAGIASRGRFVADTDVEEVRRVLETHAIGAFNCCHAVLPYLRQRPRGDIILISSNAAAQCGAGGGPYNMAKRAIEALAQTLWKEERPNNIRVNVVAPGLTETEMAKRLVRATTGIEDIKEMYPTSPFGRVGQPEDIANAVAFLVSDQAAYITGQTLTVSGAG